MNNTEQKKIDSSFYTGNWEALETALKNYEKKNPYDRDLAYNKCAYYIMNNQLDKAQTLISHCLQVFPTSYEAHYYQASIFQAQNQILLAIKHYHISQFLHEYCKFEPNDISKDTNAQLKQLITIYSESASLQELSKIKQRSNTVWGFTDSAPQDIKALIVGSEYWVSDTDFRYIGIYRSPEISFIKDQNLNLVHSCGEFIKIYHHGNGTIISGNSNEYLLPIASETPNNIHSFDDGNKQFVINQKNPKHFNYYRIKNNSQIISMNDCYYGMPIPLGHKASRKRLVLSLFIDGLSQEIIKNSDFQKLMPNTYSFFSSGTICTQVYSSGEWTFPSLATYETGLNTLNHMMFHNKLKNELPANTPTLSEYFKQYGYYTSKIDGDWRSSYCYGYTRGIDQYIYQVQCNGSRSEQEIVKVIEHLESFKETDQYLWMCIGDLHDVADEYDLSLAVQNMLPLSVRENDYSPSATSVKQYYSKNKTNMYKQCITYIDTLLGLLYSYIENNYSNDEIIISLFADHGQGYLVPNNHHFLSKERSHVAFMFRGGDIQPCITDELIATADYLPIMCKLANIPIADVTIDGKLPKTFGGCTEREYTITESIHPNDPYSAVANTKDYEIYFDNPEPTDEEGRFILGDYTISGYYKNGQQITDSSILEKYKQIFLNRIAEHIIYQ